MQNGFPETERERIRALRRAIADRIEADIALLDMLAGDADCEPYLSAPEDAALSHRTRYGSQEAWGAGSSDDREADPCDEGEEENEHGGDINDEPHDAEEDKGAEEDEGLQAFDGFDGVNYFRFRRRLA